MISDKLTTMNLIVNTDGACRGNPGLSSIGFVIKVRGGPILHQEGKRIGLATNNIAEYTAVFQALEYIKKHYPSPQAHQITVISDSQLLTKQLSGTFKVKNPKMKELFFKIKALEIDLGQVSYQHVLRVDNLMADRLANLALDKDLPR